jgi:hypothetical protein
VKEAKSAVKIEFFISICVAGGVFCQTTLDIPTQTRNVNFSKATSTTPWRIGTSLPQSCSVGQAYFKSDAPPGLNVYVCTSTDQWSMETADVDLSNYPLYSTGSGAPTSSCTAGRDLYTDMTNAESWLCAGTNTWRKLLSSSNTGPVLIRGQNGSAPATPTGGTTAFYFDATAKLGQTKDDVGNIGTMVRPSDCSPSGGFAQTIHADGTVTCGMPSGGGGSGSTTGVIDLSPFIYTYANGNVNGTLWSYQGTGQIGISNFSAFGPSASIGTFQWQVADEGKWVSRSFIVPHNVKLSAPVVLRVKGGSEGPNLRATAKLGCYPDGTGILTNSAPSTFVAQSDTEAITTPWVYNTFTITWTTWPSGCHADDIGYIQFYRDTPANDSNNYAMFAGPGLSYTVQ